MQPGRPPFQGHQIEDEGGQEAGPAGCAAGGVDDAEQPQGEDSPLEMLLQDPDLRNLVLRHCGSNALRALRLASATSLAAVRAHSTSASWRAEAGPCPTEQLLQLATTYPALQRLAVGCTSTAADGGCLAALSQAPWPHMQSLDLGSGSIGDRQVRLLTVALARLPALRSLGLRWNDLQDGGVACLAAPLAAHCPGLTALDLGFNPRVGPGAAGALAKHLARRLRELRLDATRVGDAGTAALARAAWPLLETLSLEKVGLGDKGAASVAAAATLGPPPDPGPPGEPLSAALGPLGPAGGPFPALRRLHVRYNDLSPRGWAVLVRSCPGLVALDLDLCRRALPRLGLGGAEVAALAGGARVSLLESLSMVSCGLGPQGAQRLASVPLPALRRLALDVNSVGDEGCQWLAAADWPQLRELRLDSNGITAAGAGALAPLLVRLEALHLGWNALGDEGAAQLATTPGILGDGPPWPRLLVLGLACCGIGNRGVSALASPRFAPSLQVLRLSYNEVGPAGAAALARAPFVRSLVELHLRGAALGAGGLRSLCHTTKLPSDGPGQPSVGDSTPSWPSLTLLDVTDNTDKAVADERAAAVACGRFPALLRGPDEEHADAAAGMRGRRRAVNACHHRL